MSRKNRANKLRSEERPFSGFKPRDVVARSDNQVHYIRTVNANDITFSHGPAGSGKTHIAIGLAVKALKAGRAQKIVITRPVVDSGASIGFLPGTMEEKVGPYLVPLFDELAYYVEQNLIKKWLADKTLEIVPLSMMRGRTFHNCFVVLDEAQNATLQELRMFLTRIGADSKMVITGDLMQSDLPRQTSGGLNRVINLLRDIEGIADVTLTAEDIVRHPLIAEIEKRFSDDRE